MGGDLVGKMLGSDSGLSDEEMQSMEGRLRAGEMSFDDFLKQVQVMNKGASVQAMLGKLGGSGMTQEQLAEGLHLADASFTAIFVVEMSLKLLAFGALSPPDGYFRSPWNQLDSIIVTTSVLSLLLKNVEALGALRAMRALRALRPLRTIQRFPGLKKLVNSLLRSVPGVGDVSQVCLLFLIVYGLFSMFLLMGRMGECNDPSVQAQEQCVGTFTDPETGATLERWWGNDDIGHFDHIGMAMLTLFFWRYLARRHAASFWTKQAVDILVERVRDLGKHRFVPAPIGGLLDAVVSTLSKVFAKLR